MKTNKPKSNFFNLIDQLLMINFFLVIFCAIFFLFCMVMQFYGKTIFLDFFQIIWNPIIVPLITVLIFSALVNGFISWLKRKVLPLEEDNQI